MRGNTAGYPATTKQSDNHQHHTKQAHVDLIYTKPDTAATPRFNRKKEHVSNQVIVKKWHFPAPLMHASPKTQNGLSDMAWATATTAVGSPLKALTGKTATCPLSKSLQEGVCSIQQQGDTRVWTPPFLGRNKATEQLQKF